MSEIDLTKQCGESKTTQDQLGLVKSCIQKSAFSDAIKLCQSLLTQPLIESDRIESLYFLCVAKRCENNIEEALDSVSTLLALKPNHSRALQERGYLYLAKKQLNNSLQAFHQATIENPALVASWQQLIALYNKAGQAQAADVASTQLAYLKQLPPQLLGASDLIYEGKLAIAEQVCRKFLQTNKHNINAMRLLADIGQRLRIFDDAEFLLESCIELAPEDTRARTEYLHLLNRMGKFKAAQLQAEILLAQQPDNPGLKVSLASALVGLGDIELAIPLYQQVLKQTPANAEIHLLLGHAFKASGHLSLSIESYRESYQIKHSYGDAYWSLANTKTYQMNDRELKQIIDHENHQDVSVEDRIHLCFAAGKALEDRRDFDDAFHYYERGNALKRKETGYKPENNEANIQAQIKYCTAELFERRGQLGCSAADPIFIVGLPRAGSTLLEQILASHSQVDGTMELHNILSLALRLRGRIAGEESAYPRNLTEIDDDYFRRFGEKFIKDTQAYRGKSPIFIDKMPNNFQHIGLIRLILPNAKVIDARRHPMGCCFSGFKQLFGEGQDFTYGLAEIGAYYRSYVELMDHWDKVIPNFVLRVNYEDVVEDLEGQVRRILEFCELPFESSCLDFHQTERNIKTPSSEQVRQPIFTSGLEQWRNFETHLGPLKDSLGEVLDSY